MTQDHEYSGVDSLSLGLIVIPEDRLQKVYGSSLGTLETTIMKAAQLPSIDGYKMRVTIEPLSLSYDSEIILGGNGDAEHFQRSYFSDGVRCIDDLTGRPVTAFYDGQRLVGLQRRY